jgi:hypothetical protein
MGEEGGVYVGDSGEHFDLGNHGSLTGIQLVLGR